MLLFGFHRWKGESGRKYWFNVTLTDQGVPASGGIYVFVRRRFIFFLTPLYVGKASNLRSRLTGHEKWGDAWWLHGATERHVAKFSTETQRRRVEEDLVRGLKPKMNNMLVPRHAADAPNDAKLRRKWAFRRAILGFFGLARTR